ncbi:hypothetical protein PMZ80_001078 [Knufia obscura]|uniref:Uncharacterized protein n=1 Tax=Knufia obscura TaxID=1635080 RepID=A0ABR0S270_9EURO|nr:hypothetical protein PMZ80_001078 [Knufia obscura]
MAEEERRWRQRHAHESSTISLGAFGTASYHENAQQWTFLRNGLAEPNLDDQENGTDEDTTSLLRILSNIETVAESRYEDEISNVGTTDNILHTQYSELAAASSTIQAILHSNTRASNARTNGDTVSFGNAVWLGPDGQDSGNLTVPVTAYAAGPGRDLLHIACVSRQSFEYASEKQVSSTTRIPSLAGGPQTAWAGVRSIEQVVFSRRDPEGHGGTFLAVRQASQTSVFEPLLRRDVYASTSSTDRSSLDPNRLLALPRSHTGGHDHADVCFHPHDHRKLAVVDVQGNWSIWRIGGRRTHTSGVLYKVALQTSNKIFSWEDKKRPAGVELYFDGWHRVLWIAGKQDDVDRLLVCNRQDAKLFDIKGTDKDEICSVDVRLDTRKENAYILDMQPGPSPNTCFILTTSRLLVFDFAQKEWKDTGSTRGPALLCAWQHFQDASALSLRMTTLELGDAVLIALYSTNTRLVQLYLMRLSHIDGTLYTTADDPSTFRLPEGLADSPIASLRLATMETSGHGHISKGQVPHVLQIVVQREDLSIATVVAELSTPHLKRSSKDRPTLRLPPNRSMHRSERYVDEIDDEDDLTGFIVGDDEVEESEYGEDAGDASQDGSPDTAVTNEPEKQTSKVFREITAGKSGGDAIAKVLHEATNGLPTSRRDIPKALEAFESVLEEPLALTGISGVVLLSDLFDDDTKIEDIETDSAILDRALPMIGSAVQDRLLISTSRDESSRPLLQTYEDLFEQYVNNLNPTVPDRDRVQRERQVRDVALDLYLSNRTVRRLPASIAQHVSTDAAGTIPDSDPMIFSDPIMQQDLVSRRTPAPTSASQPVPRPPSSQVPAPATKPSPLEDALARLSSYTTISRPPAEAIMESTSSHISSLLAHLPESADANPDDYDWQTTELNLAAGDDTDAAKMSSKADRKAERLAKARKKSGDILLDRSAPARTLVSKTGASQPEANIMSEGPEPAEESSQAVMPMTSTQPVRGTHTNRAVTGTKKKKKRIAGF